MISPEAKDLETEIYLSHSSISSGENCQGDQDTYFSVQVSINFIELSDMRNAFSEGFAGYSIDLTSKNFSARTKPVDVQGNKAI